MKIACTLALIALLGASAARAAEEHYYDNGVYVGLGLNASIVNRDKKINYGFPGFCGPTPFCVNQVRPLSPTSANDAAPSPALAFGFKFNDENMIKLKGDWARYSTSNSNVAPDTTGFTTVAVDGANGTFVPAGSGPTSVDAKWGSDVFNVALEYQRRLAKSDMADLFALLGGKFRYEGQSFDARAVNPTVIPSPVVDSYHETLKQFSYGPYGGVKLSLKPGGADSRLKLDVTGTVGYYFAHATFDGHDQFFNGQRFSQSDHSSRGSLFAGGGIDLLYALTKNWYLGLSYDLNWIQSAAHIWNTDKIPNDSSDRRPSKIVGTSIITHTPGAKVVFKFD